MTDPFYEQAQLEHERLQAEDSSHDRSSCWCCCDACVQDAYDDGSEDS